VGQKVLSKPSADSFAVGRRQKVQSVKGGRPLVINRKRIFLFWLKTNICQENAAEYLANNEYSAQGRKHQKNVNLIMENKLFS
jgi:hypothetical protein